MELNLTLDSASVERLIEAIIQSIQPLADKIDALDQRVTALEAALQER